LYRAVGWLGEELADQSETARALRRNNNLIEETLFESRRDLFVDLSVVLFDTTSLLFYGRGGEILGKHGKLKQHRPDLRQVIVGVAIDNNGRAICSEIWPGNATHVKAPLPVVGRLRERFGITRCVCADRGMISAETMASLRRMVVSNIFSVLASAVTPRCRNIVLPDEQPVVGNGHSAGTRKGDHTLR
jgi:transposase